MKTFNRACAFVVLAGLALHGTPVAAQSAGARPQGDVTGAAAWLSARLGSTGPYSNDQWEHSFWVAATAGWYWDDHLKTELDVGTGTEMTGFNSRQLVIENRPVVEARFSTVARRTVGVSQQYQFFRNAWFHPHVAAGVNLTWDERTDNVQPVVLYDQAWRTGRIVRPERIEGPRTELTVRPFLAVGFKAYMTRRVFFRNDLRVAFRGGVDETQVRFGLGVDF